MKKILVVNGASYADAIVGLGTIVTKPLVFFRNPEEFSLVLFTGGADVSPKFYGDTSPQGLCSISPIRDEEEKKIFDCAVANDIRCAGICRGVQFINVMSGGKMMHHLDNHAGQDHPTELLDGTIIRTNSFHHQMILPPEDAVVIATSETNRSKRYFGKADRDIVYIGDEIEAAVFPNTKTFGVQWHPEWMDPKSDGYQFFFNLVKDAIAMDWDSFMEKHAGGVNAEDGSDGAMHHTAG